MARHGLRPSRPHAAVIAVLCSAMVIHGVTQFVRGGEFHWFQVLWAVAGVAVVATVLRQGFGAKRGRSTPADVGDRGDRARGFAER